MQKQLTHEEYIERLMIANKNISIKECYINSGTPVQHQCKICKHVWFARPRDVLRGHGCPVCSGNVIGSAPEYRNSIWASEYKEYFSNFLTEEQMKSYMPHSSIRIDAKCPNCGLYKNIMISNLYRYGIGCMCQDGVSFPNKFVSNVISQLKINMKTEYAPSWAQKRKYDIYLPDYKLIIENHGGQHYFNTGIYHVSRTLEEEQQNDLLKYNLALKNGVTNYVVLDCRNSSKDWIKTSIMNSVLPAILHFKEEDIDWDCALLYAMTSLVKTSANLFNEGYHTKDISNIIGSHRSTVCRWLKVATQLGLCDYRPEDETTFANSKQIRCIELDLIFSSVRKAAEFIKQSSTSIVNCLKGKTRTAGGYQWEYV